MKRLLPLILASLLVLTTAWCLWGNYGSYFAEVDRGCANGQCVALTPGFSPEVLTDVLLTNGYVAERSEAAFVAATLTERLEENRELANLTDLRKRAWQVRRLDSVPDCPMLQARIDQTRQSMGHAELPLCATRLYRPGPGTGAMTVTVVKENPDRQGLLCRLLGRDSTPSQGVWVRLAHHSVVQGERWDSIVGYLQTDANGRATFEGLDTAQFYSVLPVDSLHEFGPAKGTTHATLGQTAGARHGQLHLHFTSKPFYVRLFSDPVLRQIQEEKCITVRTPHDYALSLAGNVGLVVGLFWLLAGLIRRRNRKASLMLPAVLLAVCGIGVVNMYGLVDPLTDSLIGAQNARGVQVGLVLACLIVQLDVVRFYQNRTVLRFGQWTWTLRFDMILPLLAWLLLPYRSKVRPLALFVGDNRRNVVLRAMGAVLLILSLPLIVFDLFKRLRANVLRCPQGTGYLLLAILLTALLFTPLGTEVGGMRVNLNLGIPVQPSEVAKYLIIVFMAAYFCQNAGTIIQYSQPSQIQPRLFRRKVRLMLWMLVGILVLMGLYLVLSDMGPALVILITFVLLYSLIKSTVAVSGTDNAEVRLRKILACDLAQLLYGALSFALCIWIGGLCGSTLLGGLLWFPAWAAFGLVRRRIQESAVLFNAIMAMFLFGGILLGALGFDSEAERFDQRMTMCTNPWGQLDLEREVAVAPTSNAQVACGLWALASGGVTGQGLGLGTPQVVPAFNTDMVLMSLGENMGLLGILAILALYGVLLWQTLRVGYRAQHGFALYLCMGVAVVTFVQLMTIVLGALGLIPLTGVTVPLMSFGMSSLIMNLVAFGLVLSLLAHATPATDTMPAGARTELQRTVERYNYPIALLSAVGMGLLFVVSVACVRYMVVEREEIMVRPVFAMATNGRAQIDYNPRLRLLSERLRMGDVYDRNGALLATSDKQRAASDSTAAALGFHPDTLRRQTRYYPMGQHLFFMTGDFNSGLLFTYDESNPVGYMAEVQHLETLRGYDNRYRKDEQGQHVNAPTGGRPVILRNIVSDHVYRQRFTPCMPDVQPRVHLRDYSALVPYLKAGLNSSRIARFNRDDEGGWDFGQLQPQDVHLTIDAALQVQLQRAIAEHIQTNYRGAKWNQVRVSVVVLDAVQGDLLASANYPLPDPERLRSETSIQEDGLPWHGYSDNGRAVDWRAFTDRDLGLTYATEPGSTAKVISGMAYLRRHPGHATPVYYIDRREIIFRKGEGVVSNRIVTMEQAYRHSSNAYFVKLINDQDLYPQLADLYAAAGVRVKGQSAYVLDYGEAPSAFREAVLGVEERCVNAYRDYVESRKFKPLYNRAGFPNEWSWAWGQNDLMASPLAMARIISAVANDGRMPLTRYTLDAPSTTIELIPTTDARTLQSYLHTTAREHDRFAQWEHLGGKTGTPERGWQGSDRRSTAINDGWYICFIDNAQIPCGPVVTTASSSDATSITPAPQLETKLAVAIRMERIHDGMSGRAVRLMKDNILPILTQRGYVQ